MQKDSVEFLTRLLETPSPSGFESDIQRVVKRYVTRFADTVEIDVHGNLIACVNPSGRVRVMLAGHCDQIGFMVTHIDDTGYLWFNQIGGIDPTVVPGSFVTILTENGPLAGVIGYKPAHLIPASERGKPVELNKLWIDIGCHDRKEAARKVRIGDPIVYKLGVTMLGKTVLASPGCDDRVGTFVVMEALRLYARAATRKSPVALYAVSTVQEELGMRGAKTSCFGIDPLVGIAVDVTHASDNPGAEAKQIGTVKLGDGPTVSRGANINRIIGELLLDTAKRKKLKVQTLSAPNATGTDANPIQLSRAGVAAALIGIPNRYMHTAVEVVDLRDLEVASRLLAETVQRITVRTSFVPV